MSEVFGVSSVQTQLKTPQIIKEEVSRMGKKHTQTSQFLTFIYIRDKAYMLFQMDTQLK